MPRVVLTNVEKLYNEIRRSSVYEDRLEYCVTDFMSCYEISKEDAEHLQRLLHAYNPKFKNF